jgi:hypothetical protein
MVAKPNTVLKPTVSEKVERVVPADLRKVVEDIERDLSRLYAIYEDPVSKQTSSLSEGSIRVQNLDIEQ